jgi:ABC-type transporter Mla subunit MlaD
MSSTSQQKGKKKIGLNTVISWGASVVIIGLMFKILHWKGGELLIAVGLLTEAFLFFILGIASMAVVEDEKDAAKGASGLEELLATSITPQVIQRLTSGFQQFNKAVEAVNVIAGSSNVSQNFIKEVETATGDVKKFRDHTGAMAGNFDQFGKALSSVGQLSGTAQSIMKDFEAASQGMKVFAKSMTEMNANFDQFNKTLQSLNQMTASTQTMMKEMEGVAVGIKAYNKNITELSKIYQAQVEAFRKN